MMAAIQDRRVWQSVRVLYLGSAALFLVTIAVGILNVFSGHDIPRGQVLAHFHSGSIGWVTLSVVATTIWMFAGPRDVTPGYARTSWTLAVGGIVSVAGYIAAFWLAFNGDGPAWMLPLFGVPTGLVVIGALVLAATHARRQDLLTTPHILLLGALLVASLGATMGILVGLSHAEIVHAFPGGEGVDMVGAHAGPMDMYLALAFAAIAETLLVRQAVRWTRWGMAQASLGVLSGIVASIALYTGAGMLVPVALLLFLAAFLVYFVRIGWRALTVRPTSGPAPAVFFGGLAFPVYIGFFVYLVAAYFSQGLEPPHIAGVVFVHVTFVAMATNWLLAIHSRFTDGDQRPAGAEPIGIWLLNVGLLAFIASELAGGRREGALLMAAGALMAWSIIVRRMWATRY